MATKPITPENMDKLAVEIIGFLQKLKMFQDVNIYCNNKRLSSSPGTDSMAIELPDVTYYVTDNIDVTTIVEYNNPETITMTFEGPLNHELNYGSAKTEVILSKIFAKYGLYFELGYAWSLAAYKL